MALTLNRDLTGEARNRAAHFVSFNQIGYGP